MTHTYSKAMMRSSTCLDIFGLVLSSDVFEYVLVIFGLVLFEICLRCMRRPRCDDAGRLGLSLQCVEDIWTEHAGCEAGRFVPIVMAGSPHEVWGARLLRYARQPAGGKHGQSGSAEWLPRELQLRKADQRNGAPRPVVLSDVVSKKTQLARYTLVSARAKQIKPRRHFSHDTAQKQTRRPGTLVRRYGVTPRFCSEVLIHETVVDRAAYLLNRHLTYRTACTAVACHCAAVANSMHATAVLPISDSVRY